MTMRKISDDEEAQTFTIFSSWIPIQQHCMVVNESFNHESSAYLSPLLQPPAIKKMLEH